MGRGIPLRVPSTWVCTRSRAPARGQYHLDKENHREVYSKKQSTGRKKQSGTSSNPAYTDVFFEPFLLRFFLSKWYCPQGDAPTHIHEGSFLAQCALTLTPIGRNELKPLLCNRA